MPSNSSISLSELFNQIYGPLITSASHTSVLMNLINSTHVTSVDPSYNGSLRVINFNFDAPKAKKKVKVYPIP